MNVNRVVLVGRLTADPDLRYLPSGDPKSTFTLAVHRPPGKDGAHETDFIDCVAWRRQAEVIAEHARKGETLAGEGRLTVRGYEKNGEARRWVEVTVTDFSFAGTGRPKDTSASPPGEDRETAGPDRRPARREGARSRTARRAPVASGAQAAHAAPPDASADAGDEDVPF